MPQICVWVAAVCSEFSLVDRPPSALVFDRGYRDYEWFASLIQQGVHFVTRLKGNADYGVVEELAIPQRRGVRRDQVIFFYKLAQAGIHAYLRRIEF